MAVLAPLAAQGAALLGSTTGAAISTGIGVVGKILQDNQARDAAAYQARILRNDATFKQKQAEQSRFTGQVQQQDQDLDALVQMETQEVQQAGSGFALSSLGLRRARAGMRVAARRDSLRIRQQAEARAIDLENNARVDEDNASMAEASAPSKLSTLFSVGETLITGASLINKRKADALTRKELA